MAIGLRYRVVDVFTDVPLAGNAVCVVLDPCPEPVMAALAREVNLSETTFPVLTGDRAYEMRIFTPRRELPFAGHSSLGTAWVLGPGRWTQATEGGTVEVEADATGAVMTQPDPAFAEVEPAVRDQALAALGLPGAEGARLAEAAGVRHLILLTESPIDHLSPDLAEVESVSRTTAAVTVSAVRRIDERTLHVRVFCPAEGIPEDPGTGSAAGPIAVLARALWGTEEDVTVLQGAEVGRPCRIEVHARQGALRVGGRVTACAEGRFTL